MKYPWLTIPLEDYEQHMALPCVGQSELMSDAIAEALNQHQPRSLVIAGCAGGNGFERVIGANVQHVIGIDINERYVQIAQQRFGHRIPALRLIIGDIETTEFNFEPVELVFAGLLFEYVDTTRALKKIRSMLLPGGVLKAVLQLPSQVETVTPSPYRSLELLSPILRLVPPNRFSSDAAEAGFSLLSCQTVPAKGGKLFAVQSLRANDVQQAVGATAALGCTTVIARRRRFRQLGFRTSPFAVSRIRKLKTWQGNQTGKKTLSMD